MHMPGCACNSGAGDRGKENPGPAWGFPKCPQSNPHMMHTTLPQCYYLLTTGCSAPPPRPISPQKSFSCSCFPIPLKLMRLLTILLHFH